MIACEERASKAEAEARIERDWRMSMQEKETKHKELISSLQLEIKKLSEDLRVRKPAPIFWLLLILYIYWQRQERSRVDLEQYKIKWSEAQHTLEELGIQLSVSKLQISEMKEKLENSEKNGEASPVWTPDKLSSHCTSCCKDFTVTRRKVKTNLKMKQNNIQKKF